MSSEDRVASAMDWAREQAGKPYRGMDDPPPPGVSLIVWVFARHLARADAARQAERP